MKIYFSVVLVLVLSLGCCFTCAEQASVDEYLATYGGFCVVVDVLPLNDGEKMTSEMTDLVNEVIKNRIYFATKRPCKIQHDKYNQYNILIPNMSAFSRPVDKNKIKEILEYKGITFEFKLVVEDREKVDQALNGKTFPGHEIKRQDKKYPFLLKNEPLLTVAAVKSAQASRGHYGEPVVLVELDETGTKIFAEVTKANIGKRIAILVDDEVIMVPVVQSSITDGKCQIKGKFTYEEVTSIANRLNFVSTPLPVDLKVIEIKEV